MRMKYLLSATIILLFINISFSISTQYLDSYIKSNYIIQNGTLVPKGFVQTGYGWSYSSTHNVYLRRTITDENSIYYNYKSINFKLTPAFERSSIIEYANPSNGAVARPADLGLKFQSNAIIYKNTFPNTDIGVAANSNQFYEIVKLNNLPMSDVYVYFKLDTNAKIHYKTKNGYKLWKGETITTNESLKLTNGNDKIIIATPKIWNKDRTLSARITLTTINGQPYLIKLIPFDEVKSMTFPIFSDVEISWITEEVFRSAPTSSISITSFNSTHFIIAYMNDSTTVGNRYGAVRIGHFNGTNIIWDTDESKFNDGTSSPLSVSSFNSTYFIVGYDDSDDYQYEFHIGHFTGTGIVWDAYDYFYDSESANPISISTLNSTDFVTVYSYEDENRNIYGSARIGHFNGTEIEWKTTDEILNGEDDYLSVSALNDSHFVIAYADTSNSGYGTAIVGHFDGSSIVWDTSESVFNPGNTWDVSITSLNSTHFAIAYVDDGNSDYGTTIVGHFTGSSIVWDTSESVFNPEATEYTSITALNSTHFAIAYSDYANDGAGTAIVGHFNGTSIVWDTSRDVFCIGESYYTSITSLDTIRFAIAYSEQPNNGYGVSFIGIFDPIPPSTSISPDGQSWTNQDVSFSLSCSDSGSGCNKTYYEIINDGDSCPSAGDASYTEGTSGTVTCTSDTTCEKRVCYYSTDNAGNIENVEQSNIFYIDKTVPTTSASAIDAITGSSYTFGNWVKDDVNVTLSCSDTGSGCANTYYCIDSSNSCTPSTSYSGTFQVTCSSGSACTEYVRYYSTDNVGNNESTKTQTIKIDKSHPTYVGYSDVSGYDYEDGSTYWVKGGDTFNITISHSDVGSGVYRQYFGFNKDACTPNSCGDAPYEIKSYTYGDGVVHDWMINDSYINILSAKCVDPDGSCTDDDASIKWSSYINTTCQDWNYYLNTFEYDKVLNGIGYTALGIWVKIDNTPPSTSVSAIKSDSSQYTFNTWTNNSYVNVTLSCSDTRSGCNKTYYCIGESCTPTTEYSGTIQISSEGVSYLRYYSTDNVGNDESIQEQIIKIDKTAPTTSISPDGSSWTDQDIPFSLSCSDSGSGCADTYYKIINDGQVCGTDGYFTGTSGTVSCPDGSKCTKRVCYYSIDNIGNTESVKQSNIFYIDKRVLFSMNVTYHINTTSDPGNTSDVVHTTYPIGSSDGDISFFIIPTFDNFSSILFIPGENYTLSFKYLVGKKFIIGLTNYSWTGIEKKAYEVSGNKYLIQPFAYPIFSSSNIYVMLTRPDVDIVAPRNCGTGERTIFMRNLGKVNGRYRIQITCY